MFYLPLSKSKPFVQCSRPRVVRPHVQERCLAACPNTTHDRAHQGITIAFAQIIRVRADSTDFRIAHHFHALTRHRGESTTLSDAEELTQLMRTRPERSWLREIGECDHLGGIS